MFNLEQAIADWRQKMLAAGIEAPVPLEELELHLREEIERQVSKGAEVEKAFEVAVQSIGEAPSLKTEFKKVPEKPRDKFIRIAVALLVILSAFKLSQWSLESFAATDFKFAHSHRSFSSMKLTADVTFTIMGSLFLILGPIGFYTAWALVFRQHPNPWVQQAISANPKDLSRRVWRIVQVFCTMFVGWMGWLICLHAVWQLADTDFSFASIGGSFSLENLLIGPLTNLIIGTGSLALGGWLIGCAWKMFRSPKAPQEPVLSHG